MWWFDPEILKKFIDKNEHDTTMYLNTTLCSVYFAVDGIQICDLRVAHHPHSLSST